MSNRLSFVIAIVVLALLVAAPAPGRADYRSAVSAYEKGDYEVARREFQALALGGDTAAQNHLGLMFKDGLGVQRNPVVALGWFFCAARSGRQVDGDAVGDAAAIRARDAANDAARWIARLSSSLDGASVRVAQERALRCRAMAENAPQPETSKGSERLGVEWPHPVQSGAERPSSAPSDSAPTGSAHPGAERPSSAPSGSATTGSAQLGTERPSSAQSSSAHSGTKRPGAKRPGSENWIDWENLENKLDQFVGELSQVEIATSKAPKSSTSSFFTVPKRHSVWSKAFFLPADGTVVGSQHVAWELGANELFRDVRALARDGNDTAFGLFAVLWWLLIGKTLMSIGRVLTRVARRSDVE